MFGKGVRGWRGMMMVALVATAGLAASPAAVAGNDPWVKSDLPQGAEKLSVGWTNHPYHGWVYLATDDPASVWAWNSAIDWMWTATDLYPWLWSSFRGQWFFYLPGSSNPRYFYDWDAAKWQIGFTAGIEANWWFTETPCVSLDNIFVPLSGEVEAFRIRATHPAYAVTNANCTVDPFCDNYYQQEAYEFTPATVTLYDDGTTFVDAVRYEVWPWPAGMTASANVGPTHDDMHVVRMYRKIAGTNVWPRFLALHADGRLQLVPQPQEGKPRVCFGNSVVVGPTEDLFTRSYFIPSFVARIASVRYDSAQDRLVVTYVDGGEADFEIRELDRAAAEVRVRVRYDIKNRPFAVFRGQSWSEDHNLIDHIQHPIPGQPGSSVVRELWTVDEPLRAAHFQFRRLNANSRSPSAPDILVGVDNAPLPPAADGF